MRLQELVDVSNAVAAVSGRLEKIERLAALLVRLPSEDIEIAVAFLTGSPRQGRIGLGWSALSEASRQPPVNLPTLELGEIDEAFGLIAQVKRVGSARERTRMLGALFARATQTEQQFLIRLLTGELRQGALEGVLVEAVARAARLAASTIRQAAMTAGDLGAVVRVALTEGAIGLSGFAVQLFRPVQPMLAESAGSVAEALQYVGDAAIEFKIDGARVQVHKSGQDVKVFSRNLRDVTGAVPEVVEAVGSLPVHELILDGEVIALRADGTPHPFQETMRRFGRRLDVERMRSELPLTPFLFDCLYLNGESLLDRPQKVRFERLLSVARGLVMPHVVTSKREEAEAFFGEALRRGHEGVMAKALDAPYVAGSRGRSWLKIKVVRTLDLVVLAAEWGHGRRRAWLSNLHLGARDPEGGGFVMLGKTFKGLTDEMLAWQTRALLDRETGRDDYTVYVRPDLIVEIAFNDIQASPQYPGGLALRFARVKGYRPDKSAAEADTLADVRAIYRTMTGNEPPAPSQAHLY